MRCPSCGTENAPDSRFCGGCGARIGASAVAPTQKITDDEPFPHRPATAPPAASASPHLVTAPGVGPARVPPTPPVSYVPVGVPHAASAPSHRPATAPPAYPPMAYAAPNGARSAPRAQTPPIDEPSMSMPIVARRPWGLIIVVLVIDIGLAAAGAWMLSQGLGESSSARS